MRSVGILALFLILSTSLIATSQCGCGIDVDPDCYLVFKTNETIEFSLVVPMDWFQVNGYTQNPRIFGWRIETKEGNVVRTVVFDGEPRNRLEVMEWDLANEDGQIVAPGYYNVIVMTTDSDVVYPVRIVDACRSFCACLCDCYTPLICDIPCCPPYGQLYLDLRVGEVRSCNGLSFSFTITIEAPPVP